jgi:hypothetical protein
MKVRILTAINLTAGNFKKLSGLNLALTGRQFFVNNGPDFLRR